MADYTQKSWGDGDTFRATDATAMSAELEEQEQKDAAQDAVDATKQNADADLTAFGSISAGDGYAKRTSGVWAPVSGIPKADLASGVQSSLNRADWRDGAMTPADHGFQSWAYDPECMFQASGSNGYLWLTAMRATLPQITQLVLNLSIAGGSLVAGQNWAGLYDATTYALLGSTADQSTNWAGAGGLQKMPIVGGPVTVTPGALYYLGWISNGGSPASMSQSIGNAFGSASVVPPAQPYRWLYDSTHGASNTTLPATAGPSFGVGTHYWGAFI